MNTANKAVLSLAIGLLSTAVLADTTSLPMTDDAFILGLRPTANYGDWDDIFVTSYGPKQGLVRFDGASIAGQDVNSATLNLYLNDIANAGTISIHALTSSWSESTVTWDSQPPAEAVATAVVTLTTDDEGTVIAIDVTDAVARWADGSLADAGFLIVTTDNIKAYFDAKEMAGGIPATLTVDTGPAVSDGRAIVLDFTDPDNCTIDEPGYYILDRSWDFSPPNPQGACTEGIVSRGFVARDVTIDLRGFTLKLVRDDQETILLETCGTVRGGTLIGNHLALYADWLCTTEVTNMTIEGSVGLALGVFRGNRVHGHLGFSTQDVFDINYGDVVVRDSIISCSYLDLGGTEHCLSFYGINSLELLNNSISVEQQGGIYLGPGISGVRVIQGNVIRMSGMSSPLSYGVHVASNTDLTVVARNIIETDAGTAAGIRISDFDTTIVDGNIIRGPTIGIDIRLQYPTVFFGNNRVSATTPFVGTEGQTDWGGNVSF